MKSHLDEIWSNKNRLLGLNHLEKISIFLVSQGDLNTRVDAAREQVDAWLAAKLGDPCSMEDECHHCHLWCQFWCMIVDINYH